MTRLVAGLSFPDLASSFKCSEVLVKRALSILILPALTDGRLWFRDERDPTMTGYISCDLPDVVALC
jgi:hypothetical protein